MHRTTVLLVIFAVIVTPLVAQCFTIPEAKLLDTEFAASAWGAPVQRVDAPGNAVDFSFVGLGSSSTGLKDDYPVDVVYGQVIPSHGNGDFSNLAGFRQSVENLDEDSVWVSLFLNTGFTGPSGTPPNNPANDTFWQSPWVEIAPGETKELGFSFGVATPWNIEDNPTPHTQGLNGVAMAVNAFDHAEVSAIGFQVAAFTANSDATVRLRPVVGRAPQLPGAGRLEQLPGFVRRQGNGFVADGRPFYFAGTNCYYLMVYAANPGLRSAVDEVLDEAAQMELRVLRTWAFNDGAGNWNALQTAPGVYQEFVFQGLDYVVAEAGRRGLRLILPLVNNWSDYGGMNQYVAWSTTASSHDDFYTDPSCRQWYKDHVQKVLDRRNTLTGVRYRDDPAILAWELANEPRCESDPSGDVLQAWLEEMATYVKSVDSRHMVTTGSEGFFGPGGPRTNPHSWMDNQGVDFIRNHAVAEIDFATLHLWPDHWGLTQAESTQWIVDHAADADSRLGRPLVVEEFGKQEPLSVRDQCFQAWFDAIYGSAANDGAAAGSCVWSLYHDAYANYDGFGIYYPAHTTTTAIISAEARRMNGL